MAGLLVLSGCGSPELEQGNIEPGSATLTVGETATFNATPRNTKGETMEDVTIAWSVEGDSGSIDAAGVFTAVKPGAATVVASVGTYRQTVTVTVAHEPVKGLQVALKPESVVAGEQAQLLVTVVNAAGSGIADLPVQASALTNGTVVNPAEANTNTSGQVAFTIATPANAQNNQVQISAGGQTATADLLSKAGPPATVQSSMEPAQVVAGQEAKIDVVVLDKANNPVPGAAVTFDAGSEGATVSPAQVTTDAQGRATAVLKAGPSAGASQVQVSVAGLAPQMSAFQSMPGAAARLTLQSDMPATIAGGVVTLMVNIADTHGNAVPNAEVQLAVSPADATLEATTLISDANGAATAVLTLSTTPGTNTITATGPGIEPAPHSIVGRAPTQIQLTPQTVTIEMLGTQAFSAVAEDAAGHTIAVTPEWRVIGENGTVDAVGTFQATGLGEATVLGQYGDLKG
ncbi:MAG: Ig-like domain-containing protein, partial [Proteobacteria bacterium]|nr:Ig-like domain-containing protein [Pseudomonadota bacterium]